MALVRDLLALIGLTVVGAATWGYVEYGDSLRAFDPRAGAVYLDMGRKLLESRNGAEATIWKSQVREGLTPQDVDQTLKTVANELNIKNVGELPLSREVEAQTGQRARFMKIYMFCNALTAARMMDHSDAYAAYLPCRVTLVEDKTGRLWLYTLNMDAMIHGGEPLPPELEREALDVKRMILEIMRRGAAGEF